MMESRPFKGWERFDTYQVTDDLRVQVLTHKQKDILVTVAKASRVQPDGNYTHRDPFDYKENIFVTTRKANRYSVLLQHDELDLEKLERAVRQFYNCTSDAPSAG
jgi:hypothetical protein